MGGRTSKKFYAPYKQTPMRPKRPGPSEAEQRQARRLAVDRWWRGVLQRRQICVGYVPSAHEVASPSPWPTWVILQALHTEYATSGGVRMTRLQFGYWLRQCGCRPTGVEHVVLKDSSGRATWYSAHTRYKLPDLPKV